MAEAKCKENTILPVLTFKSNEQLVQNVKKNLICLKCENHYEYPADKDKYLAHLFLEHRLVIADVEDIALLEDYLEFWQKEFQNVEFEEYCTTMLLDQLPDGTPAKNEKYFLLSDILPKDFELRRKLKETRLERALEQHQFERTDRNFQKECLYCRDVITGLRSEYLEHLFHKHFLQLGKPENLVYIDEMLNKVQSNLEQLVCLYCEKIFKDRVTLKEHMRKKGHKRINEANREYDKFFLTNYRYDKAKQTQQKRLHQKTHSRDLPATTTTTRTESDVNFDNLARHDDSDSDWSDWDGEESIILRCLFCNEQETKFESLKKHMLSSHCIDFVAAVQDLNFYQKIKIVNFVRRQICLLRCTTCDLRCENLDTLLQHMQDEQHFSLGTKKQWDKPEYFFPTYEDDGLLCVLDDSANDDPTDIAVRIISEDSVAQINKDAERLSLENFNIP